MKNDRWLIDCGFISRKLEKEREESADHRYSYVTQECKAPIYCITFFILIEYRNKKQGSLKFLSKCIRCIYFFNQHKQHQLGCTGSVFEEYCISCSRSVTLARVHEHSVCDTKCSQWTYRVYIIELQPDSNPL